MGREQEPIDLKRLSQRELLIILKTKVEDIENKLNAKADADVQILVRVATIETRMKEQSRVWGAISGIVTAIIVELIFKIL